MTASDGFYAVFFLVFTSCSFARCQDFVRTTYCWNQEFRLDCSWNSVLAIHEAYFTNDEAQVNESTCVGARDGRSPCTEDIRSVLNKRCSGMFHCQFDLIKDFPDRECRCNGVIALLYTCVPESSIDKYCNIKITGNSGYISSPGYPRFYPKVSNCSWNLESSKGQEMKLTILDLDMRPGVQSRGKLICPDAMTILENGHKVKYTCGQADDTTRIPVLTTGGEVQVLFKSNEFLPSRGFLLHYKFNGCRALPPPKLGYLVYSNNRSALYMCCKGHIFNVTLSNSLFLQCIDGTYWNGTVTPCLSVEEALRSRRNGSEDIGNLYSIENADVVEVYLNKHKYIEEILIPVASVVGLVFGNLAIILGIQRYRRKRKANASHHNGRTLVKGNSSSNANREVPQTLHVPVNVPIDSTIPHIAPHLPTLQQAPVVRQAPRVLMTDL